MTVMPQIAANRRLRSGSGSWRLAIRNRREIFISTFVLDCKTWPDEVAETCENLLTSLPDDSCRTIAMLMLENYTAEQAAQKLGCTRRTIQRKLLVIRRTWQDSSCTELPDE